MLARCLTAGAVVLVAACGSSDASGPRPLTSTEAERLAIVRYLNYESKVSSVAATIPTDAGDLLLDGRVDFVNHIGLVTLSMSGRTDSASAGLLQWTPFAIAFHQGSGLRATDPLPPDGWQLRRLQDKGSELDAALLLLLNLASDRPDNPQLLQQSTARWLRADKIDGTEVDVLQGPTESGKAARLTYYVDTKASLRRLTAHIGDHDATIAFTPNAAPITPLPALAPHN